MPAPFRLSLLAAAALAMAAPALTSAPAEAQQRWPNAEERDKVEGRLRELAFVSWRDILLSADGSTWSVDDAYMNDGTKYDVTLDSRHLRLLEQIPN